MIRRSYKLSAKWDLDEKNGLIKSNGQIIAKVFDSKNAKLIASLPEIREALSRVNKLLGGLKNVHE